MKDKQTEIAAKIATNFRPSLCMGTATILSIFINISLSVFSPLRHLRPYIVKSKSTSLRVPQ